MNLQHFKDKIVFIVEGVLYAFDTLCIISRLLRGIGVLNGD